MAEQPRMGDPLDRLSSRVTGTAGKPGAPSPFQQVLRALMSSLGAVGMRMPGAQPATPPVMPGRPAFQNQISNAPELGRIWQQFGGGPQRPANTNVPGAAAPEVGQTLQMRGGSPDRSHVGRLNALDDAQMQRYMDARSQGKTPQEALDFATGG